ncbi:MAG: hypothetical protein HC802_01515 [Caldilineaceae bacterium]|nr:hypothetical protein [Caldilineaceae bacterium]
MFDPVKLGEARDRFRRSSTKAIVADIMGLITGVNTDLVRYDEVARKLKARQQIEMGTRMVPLEQIVGSVGRYRDFTRTFLPRSGVDLERWSRVDAAMNELAGLPPVELFKIGEAYFVRDGNHRISVARANGLDEIEAYVTEVMTNVPITADDFERDQWLIKAEYVDFLQQTELERLRPDHDLRFTEPGRYALLIKHIEVHRYFCNLELEHSSDPYRLSWEDAVTSWYDNIYMPVVEAIRNHELMERFPNRTEADLYLWIVYHRERLARHYNLAPLSPETAVSTFAEVYSDAPLDRAVKGVKLGLHRAFGHDEKPLGMADEEFEDARTRHEAGEKTISEAELTYGAY